MTCIKCSHPRTNKFGRNKCGTQRRRCLSCGSVFAEPRAKAFGYHRLPMEQIEKVVALLVEGMSLRAISRLTGIHKETIGNILLTTGNHCRGVFDALVRDVRPKFVQLDETWSYVAKHQRFVKHDDPAEFGDAYTFIALDSETKMVLSYFLGKRSSENTYAFCRDLGQRVTGNFQVSSDGFDPYPHAVDEVFGTEVSYGQVVKVYTRPSPKGPDFYRTPSVTRVVPTPVYGDPDVSRISTSHVERFNLSLRMGNRRMARLTNAYSKSIMHMAAMLALFVCHYNFCKTHGTLRVTPGMEAKLTDRVWSIADLLKADTAEREAA